MSKQIKQFRYYAEGDAQNQPKNLSKAKLASGSIFSDCYPITQLGIQAPTGTKVYLNNSITPIMIGSTGIYELDLEGLSEINGMSFGASSIEEINKDENSYLIIDVVCGR